MPNWVYNRLTVTGPSKDLKALSNAIGNTSVPIDFPKLATVVPRTWDARDERPETRLEKINGGLVYFFDTAWGARSKLVEDLSRIFPVLRFELYYIEETEQFAGAVIFEAGEQSGEAYLGDEELEDFLIESDEWDGDVDDEGYCGGQVDREALELELLEKARTGSRVDWEQRQRKLELLRSDAETAELTRIRSRIGDITSNPKRYPPKTEKTDSVLCRAIRGFESNYSWRKHADIKLVPAAYLSELVAVQFCMTNDQNFKALPRTCQTQSFWNKFIKSKEILSVYYNPPLKKVPIRFRSDTVVRHALKRDIDALVSLRPKERTLTRCKLAVQRYGMQLKHVPHALRTDSICRIAVRDNGMSLQFVPNYLRTQALCDLATYKGEGYNALAIQFVPPKLITAKMFDFFIKAPRGRNYSGDLDSRWIPKSHRTPDLLREMLPAQPQLISIIKPEQFEEFLKIENYALRLVQESGWSFNWFEQIPESARDQKLYEFVTQNLGTTYYKSLPERYKTKVLSLEVFHAKGCEILPHIPVSVFDQAFCEQVLQSDVYIHDWRLNYKIETLVEFIKDLPAMYFPKQVWNNELCNRALEQTIFSALAFDAKHVTEAMFDEIVDHDLALFYCFNDDVKSKFANRFNGLVSKAYPSKIELDGSRVQSVTLFLELAVTWLSPLGDGLGISFTSETLPRKVDRPVDGLTLPVLEHSQELLLNFDRIMSLIDRLKKVAASKNGSDVAEITTENSEFLKRLIDTLDVLLEIT